MFGALCSGMLSFAYLYAYQREECAGRDRALHPDGASSTRLQRVCRVHPELFQTRYRVSAMAISQIYGTTITALLPPCSQPSHLPDRAMSRSRSAPSPLPSRPSRDRRLLARETFRASGERSRQCQRGAMGSRTTTGCAQPRSATQRRHSYRDQTGRGAFGPRPKHGGFSGLDWLSEA